MIYSRVIYIYTKHIFISICKSCSFSLIFYTVSTYNTPFYHGTIYNFRHHSKSENGHFTGFPHNTHLFLIIYSIYNLHKIAILTPFTYVVHVALNICFSPLTIIRNILIIYSNHLIFIHSRFVYIFLLLTSSIWNGM